MIFRLILISGVRFSDGCCDDNIYLDRVWEKLLVIVWENLGDLNMISFAWNFSGWLNYLKIKYFLAISGFKGENMLKQKIINGEREAIFCQIYAYPVIRVVQFLG